MLNRDEITKINLYCEVSRINEQRVVHGLLRDFEDRYEIDYYYLSEDNKSVVYGRKYKLDKSGTMNVEDIGLHFVKELYNYLKTVKH